MRIEFPLYLKKKNENIWEKGQDEDLQSPIKIPRKKIDHARKSEEEWARLHHEEMRSFPKVEPEFRFNLQKMNPEDKNFIEQGEEDLTKL